MTWYAANGVLPQVHDPKLRLDYQTIENVVNYQTWPEWRHSSSKRADQCCNPTSNMLFFYFNKKQFILLYSLFKTYFFCSLLNFLSGPLFCSFFLLVFFSLSLNLYLFCYIFPSFSQGEGFYYEIKDPE